MCNSTNVKSSDIVILAAVRGGTGFLAAVINTVLLMAIAFRSDHSKSLQRLLIYLTVSSLLVLLTNIFQVESVGCYYPWHELACQLVGFTNQFTSWILMLIILWIACFLASRYWCPNSRSILTPKIDTVIWLMIILFSLFVAIIPLGTSVYGMNQAWCWIKTSRIPEQWILWYGCMILCAATVILMLSTALWHTKQRMQLYYEYSRGINNCKQQIHKAEARKIKALIFCIIVYLIVVTTMSILNQIPQINTRMAFMVMIGVIQPLSVLTIPIVFVTLLREMAHCHSVSGDTKNTMYNHRMESAKIQNYRASESTRKKGYGEHSYGDTSTSLLFTETEKSEFNDSVR